MCTRRTTLRRKLETAERRDVTTTVSHILILTSTYGKIFDFIVQIVSINVENNANIQDEEGDQQVGDVGSCNKNGNLKNGVHHS